MKNHIAAASILLASLFIVSYSAATLKKVALIDQKKCIKCGNCFKVCPSKAITKTEKDGKVVQCLIDPRKCIACGKCIKGCPVKAIGRAEYDAKTGISTPVQDTTKAAETKQDTASAAKKPAPTAK